MFIDIILLLLFFIIFYFIYKKRITSKVSLNSSSILRYILFLEYIVLIFCFLWVVYLYEILKLSYSWNFFYLIKSIFFIISFLFFYNFLWFIISWYIKKEKKVNYVRMEILLLFIIYYVFSYLVLNSILFIFSQTF